jgi:ACS family hexuronate transporter-like MFS transporter
VEGAAMSTRPAAMERPLAVTWRNWIAPSAMMACTLLSYIDRQTLAALSPMILADTHITAGEYGTAISAFSVFYMIGNPLWGSLLDYMGLRAGMLLAVAVWTAASVSHAWVAGLIGFSAARALLGFGEGAAFPGALRTATESLPLHLQSRGMALGYSGASLGALITPVIVVPFALRFGWRWAFLITGLLGAMWLIGWARIARPPFMAAHRRESPKIAWPNFLERRCWLIIASFGLGGVALGMAAYLSPLYLNRALGVTQAELGRILWIPMLGWEAGYFFWGWVADRYVRDMPDRARPLRVFILLAALALPAALATQTKSLWAVLALLFWSTFVADGFVVMSLRVGTRLYPAGMAGLVAGVGSGSWSMVQAIVQPVYGHWVDLEWFGAIFVSMSLMPLAGTLLWWWLSKPAELWKRGEP